jgi:hypothetical protein
VLARTAAALHMAAAEAAQPPAEHAP